MSVLPGARRCSLGALLCAVLPLLASAHNESFELRRQDAGGALTGMADAVFLKHLATIDEATRQQARRGEAFFNTAFVPAFSNASLRDGLGPLFNAAACDNCHSRQGRRLRAEDGMPVPVMQVLQLSQQQTDGRWLTHPLYGDNLNPAAIDGVPTEGQVSINWETQTMVGAGNNTLTRSKPQLRFHDLAYGALDKNTAWSLRTAQPLFGMGLLENVAEETILALADPEDRNSDGISGRPNWIQDKSGVRLGRFGWKANHPTLRDQISAALINEQGISSPDRPLQNCTPVQVQCQKAANGGTPEIADQDLEAIVLFARLFPVPPRRNLQDKRVGQGAQFFTAAGCHQCHRPTLTTQPNPINALSQQHIHPYTDLLLHDMGDELADNRPDHGASGREWRTAPLWGIGLAASLGLPACYLHDCRAQTLEEAILWHGGEARYSKNAYLTLTGNQREALIAFLNSL